MRLSPAFAAPLARAVIVVAALAPASAMAQAVPAFGGFKHESKQPIEIISDALEVRQADQIAVFQGKVQANQGELRLETEQLEVSYDPDNSGDGGTGAIRELRAKGGVFITNGEATAKGNWATYSVEGASIVMGDEVTLTQEDNVIRGKKLRIDLNTGAGRMEGGRVRTVFSPGGASKK